VGGVKGKHLAIGLLVALFGFVGVVFWLGMSGEHSDAPARGVEGAGHAAGAPPERAAASDAKTKD